MFRTLDEAVLIAGQIGAEGVAQAAAAGVTLIVNNRPDGEEPGQPAGAEIEAAARALGLGYRNIPVASGISAEQIEAMAEALANATGKTLLFCRSGTRSTYLWALARASQGANPEELIHQAEAAGYDLTPIVSPNPPR